MKTLKSRLLNEDFYKNAGGMSHPTTTEELQDEIQIRLDRGQTNLNDIDTSKITDMYELFPCVAHNFNVSSWDVSNVIDMFNMFDGCDGFNCDLSSWDVSKVKDMSFMFNQCKAFEGKGLEQWNVSNVEHFREMFVGCSKVTIPSWYKY